MTDQPTPPASTPTPTRHPAPAKQAAPVKKVAPGKKVAPAKRNAPLSKAEATAGQPSTETNKDRAIHLDIGPLEIDIPRTLGYYGGISAAVAFGVLEPPVAVFVAVVPLIKMLSTRVAPPPLRFLAQILQGAGKPVGSDGQGTIRLNDPKHSGPVPPRRHGAEQADTQRRGPVVLIELLPPGAEAFTPKCQPPSPAWHRVFWHGRTPRVDGDVVARSAAWVTVHRTTDPPAGCRQASCHQA